MHANLPAWPRANAPVRLVVFGSRRDRRELSVRLRGRKAIVTGGSKGIGLAIATAFVREGAQVMITSRKADACESAAAELGEAATWMASNVGDPDQAEAVIDTTIERFGGVDILVNNAATNPYAGLTIDVDIPRWNKTFQTNLTAPLVWTQMCWRKHMRAHGGAVVNISTVGAFTTSPILGTYDITKAALVHMTKQLAAELAPQVRVNCIAPGLIKTDFARVLWEDGRGEQAAQFYPLKRLGEPEDIAAAAVYLAGDATWTTGQTLIVDGGGTSAYMRG